MAQQKQISRDLQDKMTTFITNSQKWSILLLIFSSILREGIELVLFLGVAGFVATDFAWFGTLLGFISAGLLSFLFYKGTIKLNLKILFNVTTVLLISFAAGLIAHGIHEFQEAGIIPYIYYPLYNLNPILDENGIFGSIIKGLFGYNGNPSLIEVILYFVYLISILVIWYMLSNRKTNASKTPKSEISKVKYKEL